MADYPTEYEFDAVLRDGDVVQIRPIRPDDDERLIDFFTRMGPQSRYFRFFRVKDSLEPDEARYFTTIDYEKRMALVAIDQGAIVAVGRYDVLPDHPEVGEVAFAVADEYQGRGIGSELLSLLTAHARRQGLTGFRAFVLADNVQMLRVFRNSGYTLTRTLEDGIYTVDFPVEHSAGAIESEDARERRAIAASLLPILFPRSVAVIGASTSPGSIGARLFANLLAGGFSGPLYPVNHKALVVNSVRAYPSVLDIPDVVDLAIVVVPAEAVLGIAGECAAKGVRGICVISAGFAETDEEGKKREAALLDLVRSSGMRMVGPNCMGLINTSASVNLVGTFAGVRPPTGNIAMSSQSGALGIAILEYALQTGTGISQFVSVGNKADVSGNDLLLAWEEDPSTDVILLYLESFGNPHKFSRIARRIAMRKPIVAVKSGRSKAGSKAASSHTGALASSDAAVDALFTQAGVIRVNTIEEQFAVASLLANQPLPRGSRVGILTNAGGPGILAADALEASTLSIPELSEETQAKLRAVLPPEAAVANPVDTIASGGPDEYRACLSALLASDEVDAVMVIYVPTTPAGGELVAEAVRDVVDGYEGPVPVLAVFMQEVVPLLRSGRKTIPTYRFPEAAALALSRAVRYSEWRARDPGQVPHFPDFEMEQARGVASSALSRLGEEGGWVEPEEVEAILRAANLPLPKSTRVTSVEEAVAAAREIGGPLAIKVISPSALHKSDVGGVVLGVNGDQAVEEAFRRVWDAVPDPEGVLIQEMVIGGHEVLIGMTEDPTFGPLLAFGMGGVLVELLGDVALRLHPLTDQDARAMILSLRTSRLLLGYRNLPEGDLEALEEALLRVSALVGAVPELAEMDLNPVMVSTPGNGVKVVDARIRVHQPPLSHQPDLVDLPAVRRRHPG
ncbi:MAG TPA: GNAT family N-acetyltransferase [Acidimicrobiia bacterium]|nr:GNAT family N-acetyltransferase [Acidimicrobiia bacterium]